MNNTIGIERNANLDLFRVFSMILIIFIHSIDHSGVLEAAEISPTWMYIYVQFTYALTQICVNSYVLLSGYFLVKSKFRLQKLLAIWMEVAFYSFLFKVIFMALGEIPFSIVSLASCLLPITTGRYWFVTIYVGLYCIFPFLNILINAMNKKQHSMLILVLIGLFSAWISIHPAFAGMNSGRGWGLPWFAVLYLIAAWIRLYYKNDEKNTKMALICGGSCLAILTVMKVFAWKTEITLLQQIAANWYKYDSLPVLIMTICTFIVFVNLQIKNKNFATFITKVGSATFGVYLIHAHAEVSPWLWETLDLPGKMHSPEFVVIQILVVVCIWAICTGLDLIRMHTVGKVEKSKMIINVCERVENRYYSLRKLSKEV